MSRFEDVADVSFMDDITLSGAKEDILAYYSEAYEEITGNSVEITEENKAVLYAAAQIFYQLAATVNAKAKQNLLKYASGAYLDNLGLTRNGLTRKAAEYATVTVRFTLSAARENVTAIPAGTRVTSAAREIYFAVNEYTEIKAGDEYVDVICTATTGGTAANAFAVGELNVLVDPIAYVASVTNTEASSGGTDEETDDDFAERIYEARNLFSTAGSEQAYIYYTKAYSTLIDDVVVLNPEDAEINIYILLKDNAEAEDAFLDGLLEYLNDDDIKPLTDQISVYDAGRVEYAIDVSYTIYQGDVSRLTEIQTAVEAAVEEYKEWQSANLGRDINNQKLISLMIAAGAAQVEVTAPENTSVAATEVASCTDTAITYTGSIEE